MSDSDSESYASIDSPSSSSASNHELNHGEDKKCEGENVPNSNRRQEEDSDSHNSLESTKEGEGEDTVSKDGEGEDKEGSTSDFLSCVSSEDSDVSDNDEEIDR